MGFSKFSDFSPDTQCAGQLGLFRCTPGCTLCRFDTSDNKPYWQGYLPEGFSHPVTGRLSVFRRYSEIPGEGREEHVAIEQCEAFLREAVYGTS